MVHLLVLFIIILHVTVNYAQVSLYGNVKFHIMQKGAPQHAEHPSSYLIRYVCIDTVYHGIHVTLIDCVHYNAVDAHCIVTVIIGEVFHKQI